MKNDVTIGLVTAAFMACVSSVAVAPRLSACEPNRCQAADGGKRYAGRSKMNFVSLVTHGLGAISVYSDVVMVRLMLLTLTVSTVMLPGM
jgi:hypothetical protein